MAWVKIDDQFPNHPKVGKLSPAWRPLAVFLHLSGLCWCNQYLTDGRIPKSIVSRLGHEVESLEIQTQGPLTAQRVAEELVAVGLWEEDDDCFIIHDFAEFQPSRREVESRRRHVKAVRSEAGSKGASKRVANRQANVQQSGKQTAKQTCGPGPDPDPNPQGQEKEPAPLARLSRPADHAPSDLEQFFDHWRAVAEQHGVLEPALHSPKAAHQVGELLAVHALDALRFAVIAFWDSPEFTGKRHIGMFRANAGQLVAHVQAGHTYRFGERPRQAPRAIPAGFGANLTDGCHHDPPCASYLEHQRRWLDEERVREGLPPRSAARATSGAAPVAVA